MADREHPSTEHAHGLLYPIPWPFRSKGEWSRMSWLLLVDYLPLVHCWSRGAGNRRVELVLGASAKGVAGVGPNGPSAPPGTGVSEVGQLLRRYFNDLNGGDFDADRYFEARVERYVTMRNTNPDAMNHYIRNVLPKQLRDHHFELEEGTLQAEGPRQYVFIERSKYTISGKTTPTQNRVQVRVRLGPNGKLTFFHQFRKLPK